MSVAPERLLAELQRRRKQSSLLDDALPVQRSFIEDPARFKAAICSRRAGKTYGCGYYLIDEALKHPKTKLLYIGIDRVTAVDTIVNHILDVILEPRGIAASYNKTKAKLTFANGSVLTILGLDASHRAQEKVLGQKYRLVVIDECASWTQNLKSIVGKLRPAVASERGTICLIGTPGDNTTSFFHAVTTRQEPGWSVHSWNYFDNPYEQEQQEESRLALLEADPGYADTAEYKQHYLGQWAISDSALVYRFDPERNRAPSLPEGKEWLHVVACDLGFEDDTAFVVLAFCVTSTTLYVVEAMKEKHLDFDDVSRLTQRLIRDYDPYRLIIDGANKQGVEQMRRRQGIAWEATSKAPNYKQDAIRLMNADLGQGRVKLLPAAEGLADEWRQLIWDERALLRGIRREDPCKANHLSDAALYGWLEAFNYASKPDASKAAPPVEDAIDAWWDAESERMEREAKADWWDAVDT